MSLSVDPTPSSVSNAAQGAVGADVQVNVLKKAMDLQALAVLTLLDSAAPPPPALSAGGSVGTQINTRT